MQNSLVLAFIHPRLKQGDLASNHARLLDLNRRAARGGADILINPELGLSGYSFNNRAEMAPCAVTQSSPEAASFSNLAREKRVWICLGYAEKDPADGVFYNSALLFDSDGKPSARRRKVTAEPRWSCPGQPAQDDVCDTPWGRLGLLICSETYYGLLPRVQALKGVDLLLVPANWPRGGLDPKELWRARSMENGVNLAACNRAGKETGIDFGSAPSCLFDHKGREIPLRQVEDEIFLAELPLRKGLLENLRPQRLAGRRPDDYHPLYAYLRQAQNDLGTCYDLPDPGRIKVHCLPGSDQNLVAGLPPGIRDATRSGCDVFLLPCLTGAEAGSAPEALGRLAADHKAAFLACLKKPGRGPSLIFVDETGRRRPEVEGDAKAFHVMNWGPARLGLALAKDLAHPEAAAAMAKLGCDLALASGDEKMVPAREIMAVKSLDRLAVAVTLPGLGLTCLPPEGHQRWLEETAGPSGICSLDLDTKPLRQKFFMDRVDYQRLFCKPGADGNAQ